MGFLGFGKKDRILDLGERYRKQQERIAQNKEDVDTTNNLPEGNSQSSSQGAFSFLGNLASSNSNQSDSFEDSGEDKKKKFAKRFMDMTNKMEDLSNQIYHLQQRVELLEKKTKTGSY